MLELLDLREIQVAAFVNVTMSTGEGQCRRYAVGGVDLQNQVRDDLLLLPVADLLLCEEVQRVAVSGLDSLQELGLSKLLTQVRRGRER